jgi:hypothetical protein
LFEREKSVKAKSGKKLLLLYCVHGQPHAFLLLYINTTAGKEKFSLFLGRKSLMFPRGIHFWGIMTVD